MSDPYAELCEHVITVKALYCENCGGMETSGYGDPVVAGRDLAARGWIVRFDAPGDYYEPICPNCAKRITKGEA